MSLHAEVGLYFGTRLPSVTGPAVYYGPLYPPSLLLHTCFAQSYLRVHALVSSSTTLLASSIVT